MQGKYISTEGIQTLGRVEGTDGWFWGTDCTYGDLYEAQQLYEQSHPVRGTRLILVSYPDGKVYEPISRRDGLYFGVPVYWEGALHLLAADFSAKKILLFRWEGGGGSLTEEASLELSAVKDCYNLRLITYPLSIIRQGGENLFTIAWPRRAQFCIDPEESIDHREEGELIFSKWYEDPDYREETVIRAYPSGEIRKRIPGSCYRMDDGTSWIVN
ncbi:MAG: hypothetical protein J5822_04835 [Eubacteriaceae bacterium]|nr:hypothetical protein [Eubacteriaceae bacterium]